ncbi:histidine kinase dimerization/phospho-acceptor domain-containing protein [Neobacillus dielmonensis]|uniref:histidine kinase dimerization/phospho-acceptor domain-containing protein n=1 Tax=Neobacillus dielmonensis TaxID=1347369 RepID=UPI0005A8ACA9|nr:histidine kinase dimerization/phospho-acceptor domain-containing protein [Neobacillus dielmonensis]
MDTKWKNRLILAVWAFLVSFGLSGILAAALFGSHYIYKDYFHTPDFQYQVDQFAGYLSTFELHDLPLEEAKKAITVTKEDIDEHRYRYGTLPEQVDNIKAQYEERIQGALDADNQDAVDAFKAERDGKIEDITNNFKSDDYVRPKVMKEKENKLEEYYKKREGLRSEFERENDIFEYYFKNTETKKVYTDLPNSGGEAPKNDMNKKDSLYFTTMTIGRDYAINNSYPGYEQLMDSIIPTKASTFEGKIAIPKSLPVSNPIMDEYENYKHNQWLLLICGITGMIALLLSLWMLKKSQAFPATVEKWRPYYNKLPLDVRVLFFILTGIGFTTAVFSVSSQSIFVIGNPVNGVESVAGLIIASFCMGYTYLQWKYLSFSVKDWQNAKAEWKRGLIYKAGKKSSQLFKKVLQSLKEAFLSQTAGIQILIIMILIYGLGAAAVMTIIHPIFILMYLILIGVIGIPLALIVVNKIGYFNRIVDTTKEIASGKLGDNLDVSGKTVLATLAGNINVLKQGYKHSQNEQAKSERLKTELITNVSHDLRTPLTSIITYTELLKNKDVSNEDRAAYLEIIDRKSKRLKVLIDDLFEVSKMASGNMELNKEKVDLVQLLQQALGEYDDIINDSSLQFRVTNTEKPIYALVDGQKMWRVFDNLIGNILKYSLENSRVYIAIKKDSRQALITFKNVSKYELNENSEELFERFKRGDTSRHTDGSGLGLAIAKSIVDLHEGRLEIETDGDLFKVSIMLNLAENH